MEELVNIAKKETITIGPPARCARHDIIHFTGYRETNIIALVKTSQPSHLPEIQIWLVSGYSRLIKSRRKWKFATQIDEMTLRDSREMNYDSKLQSMSWFCYNM